VNTRPSHKELTRKLREASALLASSGFLATDIIKLGNDFQALKCYTSEEQRDALGAAFSEVTAKNYRGQSPPDKSFEEATRGSDMFTFVWTSAYFKQKMYLKFCLQESDEYEETDLYIFSLHIDSPKPPQQRRGK